MGDLLINRYEIFSKFSIMEILQRLSLHQYTHLMSVSTVLKDKCKFHPRTCREVLEREHRYSGTVSLTVALYVGISTL
jgi:hypothetical protein